MPPDPTALPKYLQVSETLLREIAAGRLRVGDRLPPERRLALDLDVAVGTLRKALDRLVETGVLERRHGSGNYIAGSGDGAAIYALFPLERPDGGGLPHARVVSVERMDKPSHLPVFGRSADAHRIRRLRRLDASVVAAEEIWLDAAWADRLVAEDLSESLYLFYRTRLGLWITGSEDRVSVDPMPGWAADTGLPPGAPCGRFNRRSLAADGSVPEISATWFNPARAVYVARSGRERP